MKILKSIGSVLGGIFVGAVLTVATNIVLHLTGVFPPLGQPTGDALLLLATAYRIPFNTVGSYVVARLAPDRPMQHALASGVVGVVVCSVGAVVTWDKGLGSHSIHSLSSRLQCPAPGRAADFV
ncbi:MAG: hypothetical protein JWR19_3639 [Pedosphaera sp.]|nr:hypothetical protein [Pedosphaera sp.]